MSESAPWPSVYVSEAAVYRKVWENQHSRRCALRCQPHTGILPRYMVGPDKWPGSPLDQWLLCNTWPEAYHRLTGKTWVPLQIETLYDQ